MEILYRKIARKRRSGNLAMSLYGNCQLSFRICIECARDFAQLLCQNAAEAERDALRKWESESLGLSRSAKDALAWNALSIVAMCD